MEVAEAAAKLWTGAILVPLLKPAGGIRPIALAEALLKFAEVVVIDGVGHRVREVLEPSQLGCRTPAGAELIARALRTVAASCPTHAIVQLDLANAYGRAFRSSMLEASAGLVPELATLAAAEWATPGCTAWARTEAG